MFLYYFFSDEVAYEMGKRIKFHQDNIYAVKFSVYDVTTLGILLLSTNLQARVI